MTSVLGIFVLGYIFSDKGNRSKNDKRDYIKLKSFCMAKETVKQKSFLLKEREDACNRYMC